MAAGDKVFACRGGLKNATPITDMTHFSFGIPSTEVVDEGDPDSLFPEETAVTYYDPVVTVYTRNPNTALALVGTSSENLICQTKGASGANEKITFKGWTPTRFVGEVQVNAKDAGGKIARWAVQGRLHGTNSDTLATMVVAAADT